MLQLKLWEAERTRAGEAEERRQGKVAVIGVEVRKNDQNQNLVQKIRTPEAEAETGTEV